MRDENVCGKADVRSEFKLVSPALGKRPCMPKDMVDAAMQGLDSNMTWKFSCKKECTSEKMDLQVTASEADFGPLFSVLAEFNVSVDW